jgi:hypothetical protein
LEASRTGGDGPEPKFIAVDWLHNHVNRIMLGEPSVLALLQDQDWSGPAPKQLRLSIYEYEFTERQEREQSHQWWRRKLIYQSDIVSPDHPMETRLPFHAMQ